MRLAPQPCVTETKSGQEMATLSELLSKWRIFGCIAASGYFVLLMAPWRFSMPGSGLDASAQIAVAHAFVSGWQWGRDIIFAFGPLGFLYSKPFVHGTLLITVTFWTAAALAIVFNVLALLRPLPFLLSGVLFLFFCTALAFSNVDALCFMVPMLAAIGHFRAPNPVSIKLTLLLAVVAGVAALIKVSFGVLSLLVFVILDVDRARIRTLPSYCPTFLAAFMLSYLCAGQEPQFLAPLIQQSLETMSGYSEAMQLWGNTIELTLFLLSMAVAGLAVLYAEFFAARTDVSFAHKLMLTVCLGALCLVIFKAGFVRQDLHTLISFGAVGAGMVVYAASVVLRLKRGIAAGLVVIAATMATFPLLRFAVHSKNFGIFPRLVEAPLRELAAAGSFIANPEAWLFRLGQQRDQHLAVIRREIPLPSLDGTVDMIPSSQAAIMSHGLDYRPRPNLQEYAAYTGALADLNLRFIRSERAPKYIFHSTGSIDDHYPSLADGPMWPEFLSRYEPLRFEGRHLLLRRRLKPVEDILSEPVRTTVHIGENVALPDRGARFITIETRKTLFGRVAQLLFRPGLISLTVKLANGTERTYRLVPEIARRGFVLSPLVDNNVVMAALFAGKPELFPQQDIVGFRIDVDGFAALVFQPSMDIRIQALRPEKWRMPSLDSEIELRIARYRNLIVAANSSALGPPWVALEFDQLFAHAPTKMSIPAPDAGRLTVGFGIRDGAWTGAVKTGGVCFRVSHGDTADAAVMIWQRCLRPATVGDDRGEQTASIAFAGQSKIFLETDCAGDCSADWSYWSRIDVAPQ